MSAEEKRKTVKKLFRGYKKMTRELERSLNEIGIQVEYTKKHIKLYYNGKLFTCATSASDHRAGLNLASVICHAI